MDLRKLKKLIDLVQESGIGEIEITEGEERVRISRQVASAPVVMAAPAMQHYAPVPGAAGGASNALAICVKMSNDQASPGCEIAA